MVQGGWWWWWWTEARMLRFETWVNQRLMVAFQYLFFSFHGSTNSLILAVLLAVLNEVCFTQSLWKLNCDTM